MTRPRIGIVISTTREGRFGDKPAISPHRRTIRVGTSMEGQSHFQAHTCPGSDSHDEIRRANKAVGKVPGKFAPWARLNFPVRQIA
jgi:hypothetical protein